MDWICAKTRLIKRAIGSLKLEPYVLLFFLSTGLSDITTQQLIQDKICLNKYNQSEEFCIGVSTLRISHSDNNNTKSQILADLAQFSIYGTLIGSLPSFFYVLFIGSWTDNYIHGRKISLLLGALGYAGMFASLLFNAINFELDVHYILLSYIPPALLGGWSCVWLTCFSYMSNNSSEKYRFFRFAGFDVIVSAAGPLGTYLGGRLLGTGNLHTTGSIHNYERVLTTSLIGIIIGFFWVLIVINENKKLKLNDETSHLINAVENEIQENTSDNNNNNNNDKNRSRYQKHIKQIDRTFKFSKIFDLKNLKEVFRTAVKVRPNSGRTQLWLLYLSMCTIIMSDVRNFSVLFPFVEDVYDWNATYFSEIKSLSSIIEFVVKSLIVTTFSVYFKLTDTKLGMIGLLSILFSALSVGSVIYPIGLYLMYALGSASNLGSISIRSLISKLASESESGKCFSLLAALETTVPSINVLFYNTLFEYTIDFYPSLCFQIAGALMFLPLLIFIWIDLTKIHLY